MLHELYNRNMLNMTHMDRYANYCLWEMMIIQCMIWNECTMWQTEKRNMNRHEYTFAYDLKGLLTGYSSHCKYDRGRWYWLTAYWNGSVSPNHDTGRWYWLTAYWNGSISPKYMQRNLRRSLIWLAMSPNRRSIETSQYVDS